MISKAYSGVFCGQKSINIECLDRVFCDAKALWRFTSLVSGAILGKGNVNNTMNHGNMEMCDLVTAKDFCFNGRNHISRNVGQTKESNSKDQLEIKDPTGLIGGAALWMLPRGRLCDPSCFTNIKFSQFNTRRGFAKQRKQKFREEESEEELEDEDAEDDQNTFDLAVTAKTAALSQMEAAMDALSRELAKLRVGRASAGMLDHIMVEHYGVETPLNRMAVVSVLDPKTLSVTPHDPNSLKELEKAILSSPLGLNPKSDNQRLVVPIPPMTKEHMQAVLKVVAKSSENVKQSIRRARQKAMDTIKKATAPKKDKSKSGPGLPEEEVKRMEKEIEGLTKKFIEKSEELCKAKEKDIRAG